MSSEDSKKTQFKERFQTIRYYEPLGDNDAPAREVLPNLMRKLGMKSVYTLNALVTRWPEIVGEENAKHCRPGKLQMGRLTVYVENHIWNMTLKRHTRNFLASVKKHFPEKGVNQIYFQIDPEVYDPQAAPKHYIPNEKRWGKKEPEEL